MSNYRAGKRYFNRLLKKAGYGKFVLDCRGHPCRVVAVDKDRSGCSLVSLLDGTPIGCSYYHCGLEPIPEYVAKKIKEPIFEQAQYDALNLPGKWAWDESQ
jgi:hypothetical protein